MYSNKENVNILTSLLVAHGVRHAVVCPGSRDAAIVHNLNECEDITCYPVTDERSAGFQALGLSMAEGYQPVVVCVTSGSALLNLYPAVAEAYYQQIPLIVISADRPAQWINQLDGQTLPQPDALGQMVRKSVSLPEVFAGAQQEEMHWYCNRLVNEALLKSMGRVKGPVYALQNILQNGDHIVAADNIYGGTYNLITHTLSTQGVSYTIVDPRNFEQVETAIQDNTKALYAETFGNPNSDVTDIDKLAEIAHRHNIPLIIDNTFGTPYLIRPIEHGADIVVHSATKFIGGHGSSLGGVIVDGGKFDWKANADKFPTLAKPDPSYHGAVFADVAGAAAFVTRIRAVILRDTGATISPFNAWILLQGLETLSLRVERHVQNALKVVEYLENNPKVAKVNHPAVPSHPDHELYKKLFPNGGGSIFTFDIKGGEKEAWEFIDHLRIFSLLANVADVKSLVIHPATTTHSQLSPEELEEQHIYPSTVRLSIGIENIDDLIEALDEAFTYVK